MEMNDDERAENRAHRAELVQWLESRPDDAEIILWSNHDGEQNVVSTLGMSARDVAWAGLQIQQLALFPGRDHDHDHVHIHEN